MFADVMSAFRQKLDLKASQIVVGELGRFVKNFKRYDYTFGQECAGDGPLLNQIIANVAERDGMCLVSSLGLNHTSYGDGWDALGNIDYFHFDRPSSKLLGERYATCWLDSYHYV